jgi:glycosyltransferase involved in cell wall biosynthesis
MKILFQNRKDALTKWGGDTTQMIETANALEALGVQVDTSLESNPDLSGYDLVHVFNIKTGAEQVRNARVQHKPIALSTIFWPTPDALRMDEYLKYHSNPCIRSLARISKPLARLVIQARRRIDHAAMLETLKLADILLPNSMEERDLVADAFLLPELKEKSVIVPNAVRAEDPAPKTEFTKRALAQLPTEYLLQAASFDPGKCQLNLIEALMDLPDIPVVFIGGRSNNAYFQACRSIGDKRGNTFFVDQTPHDQMGWFYQRARVHALPSLRESPGLATMEAAINGANCVVSIHGPVREYFGDLVWLCDPFQPHTITKAVLNAWKAPHTDDLKNRILSRFTWEAAAQATLQGYKRVLSR